MVERYLINYDERGETLHPSGDFVHYQDYARLQERVETLRKELDEAIWAGSAEIDKRAEAEAERDRLREALQEYENPSNWGVNGRFDANSSRFDGTSFAHGVLAALQKEPQP